MSDARSNASDPSKDDDNEHKKNPCDRKSYRNRDRRKRNESHREYDDTNDNSSEDSYHRRRRRKKREKKSKKRRKKRSSSKRCRHDHYSDDSSDGESTSDSSAIERRRKHRKNKKKYRMEKELNEKEAHKDNKNSEDVMQSDEKDVTGLSDNTRKNAVNDNTDSKSIAKEENEQKQVASRRMVPMTREQYEAEQSKVREVYDPESGRMRLVRGSGEIIERIVSRQAHQQINQQATRGDGASFSRMINKASSSGKK